MDQSQIERVKELYDELCDASAADRDARLAAEPDAVVREEVADLLRYDESRGFLASEPVGAAVRSDEAFTVTGFEDLQPIGAGGMGTVFRATQLEPRRTVAIKLLRETWTPSAVQRFEQEARILARLDHPHIARVFSTGSVETGFGSHPYFVMEYLEGQDLLAAADGMSRTQRLLLFAQVCDAIDFAHRRGVVHRDLKPENVLVVTDSDGTAIPRVLDFGIAHPEGDAQRMTRMTETGQVFGTLPYMSPEQLVGRSEDTDARVDVYALGIVLCELLTGERPHDLEDTTVLEAMRRIRDEEPRRLGSLDPELRGDLETIVSTASHRTRELRYATAADLAADVRRHLDHLPIRARPFGLPHRVRKFARRNRLLVGTTAIVLGVLAAGLGWSLVEARSAKANLEAFDLLAWASRLEEAQRSAKELREHEPDDPRLAAWEREHGSPLLAALPTIRKAIAARREDARPLGSEPSDWNGSKAELELERLRSRLVKEQEDYTRLKSPDDAIVIDARANQTLALDELKERIKALDNRIQARQSVRFATLTEAYVHDALVDVESALSDFAAGRGLLAETSEDAAWAEVVRSLTVDEHAQAWTETIQTVAQSERYDGLRIMPQVGLVPLGADPDTGLQEFAHLRSGSLPRRDPETGRLRIGLETGLVFVLLPGGSTRVGAQREAPSDAFFDGAASRVDVPIHTVELDPFFLSKYEMTKGQWQRMSGGNEPDYWRRGEIEGGVRIDLAHPVESVSWHRCRELLGRSGLTLPTEAQWEYGARAGTTTMWWSGADKQSLTGVANLVDLSARDAGFSWRGVLEWPEFRDGHALYARVDLLAANPFGLHHVHGNVAEWCADPWSESGAPRDGDGLRTPATLASDRPIRGGSMSQSWKELTAARRLRWSADSDHWRIGLRPARGVRTR